MALESICNSAGYATKHKHVLTSAGKRRADLEILNIQVARNIDLLVDITLRHDFVGAGHNGLKDINAMLGTQDYWRLRLGIGHPGDRNEVANYVLKPARREEQYDIDDAIKMQYLRPAVMKVIE